MTEIKINLHTHTHLCKHATGTVQDYCAAAVAANLKVLGISDHTPLPDNRWLEERMEVHELDSYLESIEQARMLFPSLQILTALECEYAAEYASFYRDELLTHLKCDYLIGAVHYVPFQGAWISVYEDLTTAATLKAYAAYFIDSMASGLFAFMAHPDLFGYGYADWDANTEACTRDMLEAAQALRIPLEINGNGFNKKKLDTKAGIRYRYPWEKFWEIAAEYEIEVIANSDAHQPDFVVRNINLALAIARKYQLKLTTYSFLPPEIVNTITPL